MSLEQDRACAEAAGLEVREGDRGWRVCSGHSQHVTPYTTAEEAWSAAAEFVRMLQPKTA